MSLAFDEVADPAESVTVAPALGGLDPEALAVEFFVLGDEELSAAE